MALDGITVANIIQELNTHILNGRIYKISQPEADELLLTIKAAQRDQYRLLLSANASLPLVYLTSLNKVSPMTAPNFCMLLRKHIQNGRIISITQPSLERIIRIEIEHLNELGDLCRKFLIIELMGKHSNIIFCNEDGTIIDSIKHISAQVSSIREVLPGRTYFIPVTVQKLDPLTVEKPAFWEQVFSGSMEIKKSLYNSLTGISPVIAGEICQLAEVLEQTVSNLLSDSEKERIWTTFFQLRSQILQSQFKPCIIYKDNQPLEFASLPLTQFEQGECRFYPSISEVLTTYFSAKDALTRIRQKSVDLRRIVTTALERNKKKYQLQSKQLKDTEKRDRYKVYGELITTYGYGLEPGATQLEALNYYTNEMITIPLDKDLTPLENAKKYFDKYNKLKRTNEALTQLIQETEDTIQHLDSVSTSLDIALSEEDLIQIKEELIESGYLRRKLIKGKKEKITSSPLHYLSSDGYDIYVGKNNLQNEELTFKIATGNDWWFHAKGIPGSHVIVKSRGDELPDRTFEEAGRLAAFYSKARGNDKVEIDYIQKKAIKKPNAGKPGFVIYHSNYSLMIDSDISSIQQVK